MDDLPVSSPTTPPTAPVNAVGSMAKEVAPLAPNSEAPLLQEVGKEAELSSEVQHAGVRMQSETIELPPPIVQAGVKVVGPAATPATPSKSVPLPLSDDQIAQGLTQSITSSIRWLAEWCERQLKAVHVIVKNIHGKGVRSEIS